MENELRFAAADKAEQIHYFQNLYEQRAPKASCAESAVSDPLVC